MKQRALLHGAGDTSSVPGPPSLTRVVAVTALGLSVLIGVAAIAGTIPDIARHLAMGQDWAVDGDRMFTASAAFGNGGDPYVFQGYLYSPLLTAVVWPLTRLGLVPAIVTWACLKAVVVAICVWDARADGRSGDASRHSCWYSRGCSCWPTCTWGTRRS